MAGADTIDTIFCTGERNRFTTAKDKVDAFSWFTHHAIVLDSSDAYWYPFASSS
jgi:hypothetical protein